VTTGSLLARVAAPANIQLAWSAVLENDRDDGRLAPGVRSFAEHAVEALGDIAASLVAGTYVSSPLHRFSITDPDGDQRHLHIPEVSDRIVERAIVQVANVVVEPLFSPWSFGYRPGLGVPDACRRLALRRDEGCTHVVRVDVRNCFDSLDRARLARLLDGLLDDEQLVELIVSLMARPVRIDGRIVPTDRGVAQGGPLSPWLSNVYLHEFDVRLAGRGNPAIRYADDMAIPTVGLDEAEDALRYANVVAAELGLELNKEKTRLVTFAEGFAFLGEEFTAGYPPPDGSAPQEEPDRRVLYVAKDGAVVRSSKGQIIVSEDTENLLTVPSSNVGAIVLFGNVGLSAGARAFALANGVSVSFVSRRGQFQGWLQGAVLPSARTRREQYRQSDHLEFQLMIAQKFVAGKIANLSALLLRYGYRNKQLPMLDTARDLEKLPQLCAPLIKHARTARMGRSSIEGVLRSVRWSASRSVPVYRAESATTARPGQRCIEFRLHATHSSSGHGRGGQRP
jgi:CRISP-associated protein Cas1